MDTTLRAPGSRKRTWSATNESLDSHAANFDISQHVSEVIQEAEARAMDTSFLKEIQAKVLEIGPKKFDVLAQRLEEMMRRAQALLQDPNTHQKAFAAATWWINFRLRHALETSAGSVDDAYYKLQLFPDEIPNYLVLPDYPIPPKDQHLSPLEDSDPGPEVVASWIEPFICPINDCRPLNFQKERMRWSMRRSMIPALSRCAVLWPMYAEKYWDELGPKVLDLLDSSRPYRLSHWFMEVMFRSGWYSGGHKKPDVAAKAMHALADGSMGPLELAATLGLWPSALPYLYQDRIRNLSQSEQSAGTTAALVCAFIGFDILSTETTGFSSSRVADRPWAAPSCLLPSTYKGHARFLMRVRGQTIKYLCQQAGPLTNISFPWKLARPCSLASLGFLAAATFEELSILEMVLDQGANLDLALIKAISLAQKPKHLVCLTSLRRACLTVLDHALVTQLANGEAEILRLTIQAVDNVFRGSILEAFTDHNIPIRNMTLDEVIKLAVDAVVDDQSVPLQRALLDPRFVSSQIEPNAVEPEHRYLHIAVANDSRNAMTHLIVSGIPANQRDDEGRTPLMLVESREALSLLVELGASTTDTDRDGRNIWHLTAASNDADLISWLCRNDPNKQVNLRAINNLGRTPLADALCAVHEFLDNWGIKPSMMVPEAAKILLREDLDKECLRSDVPLAGLAVRWGAVDVIDKLLALGVDFCLPDMLGRVPLQHINLWTPVSTIQRLIELTDGPINTTRNEAPSVAILQNTIDILRTLQVREHEGMSGKRQLNENIWFQGWREKYVMLLNQESTDLVDHRDYCSWEHLCRLWNSCCPQGHNIEHFSLVEKLFESAVVSFIGRQIHKKYECEKQVPAWRPMLSEDLGKPCTEDFVIAKSSVFRELFDQTDNGCLSQYGNLPVFHQLLNHWLGEDDLRRSQRLIEAGTPLVYGNIHGSQNSASEWKSSALENLSKLLFRKCRRTFDYLVDVASPDELSTVDDNLFLVIFKGTEGSYQMQMMEQLLAAGMRVNVHHNAPIRHAVAYGDEKVAKALLSLGADILDGGPPNDSVCCALMMAARLDRSDILPLLLQQIPDEFPWDMTWQMNDTNIWDLDNGSLNIIQVAAGHCRTGDFLRILFKHTTGYEEAINKSDKMNNTAAQIAAARGNAEVLRLLWEHGADLGVRYKYTPGWTILHAAVHRGVTEIVSLLAEIDPDASSVPDDLGDLPHKVAPRVTWPEVASPSVHFG